MYRAGNVYKQIDKTIIQIYIDYDIRKFPVSAMEVCQKLSVALIPYSEFSEKDRVLLKKRSVYGFFVPETKNNPPSIYYNDSIASNGSKRLTVFHELKHYVCEDGDDKNDDLADHFGRYFMCPTAYFLLKKIDTVNAIMSYCGLSESAAKNVCSNIRNRKEKYGYHIFDYEIPLIEHLEPILLEVYKE